MVYDSLDFFGTQMVTLESRRLHVSQRYYAISINFVKKNSSFGEYRPHKTLFSRLYHTRPDIAFYANKAAQVTKKAFSPGKILELNKQIQKFKSSVSLRLTFKTVELKSVYIRVYYDAFIGTNDDHSL